MNAESRSFTADSNNKINNEFYVQLLSLYNNNEQFSSIYVSFGRGEQTQKKVCHETSFNVAVR